MRQPCSTASVIGRDLLDQELAAGLPLAAVGQQRLPLLEARLACGYAE
jgi:hypothetical protein